MDKIPEKVLVTSDMWTSIHKREAYLNIIIYYINSTCYFLLDIIPFQGYHTEKNMAIEIQKVLYEFNLKYRILGFTIDKASSIIACNKIIMNKLSCNLENHDFNHYRCVVHILNFVA